MTTSLKLSNTSAIGIIGATITTLTYVFSRLLFPDPSWGDYFFARNVLLGSEAFLTAYLVWLGSSASAKIVDPVRFGLAAVALTWVTAIALSVLFFGALSPDSGTAFRMVLLGFTGIAFVVSIGFQFADRGAKSGMDSEASKRAGVDDLDAAWKQLHGDLQDISGCPRELLVEVRAICEALKFSSESRSEHVKAELLRALPIVAGRPLDEDTLTLARRCKRMLRP